MTKKVDFISWIPSQTMLMWEHMFLFSRYSCLCNSVIYFPFQLHQGIFDSTYCFKNLPYFVDCATRF